MDSTFSINIRFVGTHKFDVDRIELEEAFLNTILSFSKAGEIKLIGGMEGVNIDIRISALETTV